MTSENEREKYRKIKSNWVYKGNKEERRVCKSDLRVCVGVRVEVWERTSQEQVGNTSPMWSLGSRNWSQEGTESSSPSRSQSHRFSQRSRHAWRGEGIIDTLTRQNVHMLRSFGQTWALTHRRRRWVYPVCHSEPTKSQWMKVIQIQLQKKKIILGFIVFYPVEIWDEDIESSNTTSAATHLTQNQIQMITGCFHPQAVRLISTLVRSKLCLSGIIKSITRNKTIRDRLRGRNVAQ